MEQQINYTALLEKEYGSDPLAMQLVNQFRSEQQTDEKIYQFLESFY